MTFNPNIATIMADGPAANPSQPSKPLFRQWGTNVEAICDAFTTNAGLIYTTMAAMNAAASTFTEPRSAWQFEAGSEGVYVLNPSTDTWTKVGRLPYGWVPGTDLGAGTANAIQITTDTPVADGMAVFFSLYEATTASPVTISINGGTALTLKTVRGGNASALGAGQEVWFRVRSSDSTARMISDQDVAALVAQAEAARDAAVAAAPSGLPTIAALKAADHATIKRYYLAEVGREGWWTWRDGDYSSLVAADTYTGVYAKADDTAASLGCFQREVTDHYLATWFGYAEGAVVGNGARLQSAITLANGLFTVVIPPGDYTHDVLVAVTKDYTRIVGPGAIVRTSGTNNCFTISSGSDFATIESVRFISAGLGNGYGVRVNGNYCTVQFCEFEGFGDAASTPVGWGIYFDGAAAGSVTGCRALYNYIHDGDGGGIGQYASADSQIVGNRCVNLGLEGVTADRSGGNHAIIAHNHITNVCLVAGVGGIGIDKNNYLLIYCNQIRNSNIGAGITCQNNLGNSDRVSIIANVLVNNAGGGIRFKNNPGDGGSLPGGITTNSWISGNMFKGNGSSIVIDAGCTGNKIGDNDYGDDAVPSVPNGTKGVPQVMTARNTTLRTDVTGDGTIYTIPHNDQVMAKGIAYNTSTGVATIGIPGYYRAHAAVRVQNLDAGHTELLLAIDPSVGGASRVQTQLNAAASPAVSGACITSRVYQFAAGDTISSSVRVIGGTKTVDVSADSSSTYFSVELVAEL